MRTATAIALFVDAARMPVYLVMQHNDMIGMWPWITLAAVGVIIGTVLGSRTLMRIPEVWFHRVLALVLGILGSAMVVRGFQA